MADEVAATSAPAAAAAAAEAPAAEAPAKKAEDPERAAKKAAKLAEKLARKQKALERAAAEKAKQAAAGPSKKAKAKAEAEAKRAAEAAEIERWVEQARATPKGERKELPAEMPKGYAPRAVEAAWYDWWEKERLFASDPEDDSRPPFVMVIPPPNVTGSLHIGHAVMVSIEDTIARWRRASGYNVCWVPGTDHAGIATQTVVEKQIAREGLGTRHDLGREAFLEKVWEWVGKYGDRILYQLRRLGASLDWDHQVFTMDPQLSAAVKEAFLRLHAKGLIYRDHRLVNWDSILKTAVSDIEVDYIEIPGRTGLKVPGYAEPVEFGAITSFAYKLEDGSGEVVVATTRPETMFGDTAVAVHPDDPRYKDIHGKFVVHPINGRRIPIVLDPELVDMSFGTGAVKITPAHDPNDFAAGKRHSLEFINVLDDEGRINSNGTGEFAGMPRFEARVKIVDKLKELGLFRGVADNPMRLGLCSRSGDVIEPVLKPQWWVDCSRMGANAAAAVRNGDIRILPKEYEATWYRWLDNIRDWCISRQLWWGHRIPAYYVSLKSDDASARPGGPSEDVTRWVVAASEDEARAEADKRFPGEVAEVRQDEDVLDTWFSSGLFPFSVFGWPTPSTTLDRFYPGALLETGHDILFFWVARMVMMGMELMGQVPFKDIYLHSIVRDAHGRKMSKSLGNVIDPVAVIEGITLEGLNATLVGGNLDAKEIEKAKAGQKADFPEGIEECGTDALRFALVNYSNQGRDINLDIKRVIGYRHWCNKLWNAVRFAMLYLKDDDAAAAAATAPADAAAQAPLAARWILSRLDATVRQTVAALEGYDLTAATNAVYAWWQYELCDIFIEVSKPVLSGPNGPARAATRAALATCLDEGLRLLHPFMPFVTEELWQNLQRDVLRQPDAPRSISLAPYPAADDARRDAEAEARVAHLMSAVTRVRALRVDYGLNREKVAVFVSSKDDARRAEAAESTDEFATLATASRVVVLAEGEAPPAGCGVAVVDDAITVHLELAGVLDVGKEVEKLSKKEGETASRVEQLTKKMSLLSYQEGTPQEIQAADRERLQKAEAELESLRGHLAEMKKLL